MVRRVADSNGVRLIDACGSLISDVHVEAARGVVGPSVMSKGNVVVTGRVGLERAGALGRVRGARCVRLQGPIASTCIVGTGRVAGSGVETGEEVGRRDTRSQNSGTAEQIAG